LGCFLTLGVEWLERGWVLDPWIYWPWRGFAESYFQWFFFIGAGWVEGGRGRD